MSKRDVLLLVFLFVLACFFTVCIFKLCLNNMLFNENIITNKYEDSKMIINIKYPRTNSRLDSIIYNYINNQIELFKNNYADSDYMPNKDSFVVDYKYYAYDNRYLSLVLFICINSYKLNQPIYEVKSYFYDIKENKQLLLDDIVDDNIKSYLFKYTRNKLKNSYYNYIILNNIDIIFNLEMFDSIPFFVDDKSIYFYFTPDLLASDYYEVLDIRIPIRIFKFNL